MNNMHNLFDLNGHVALVTGGNGGLGLAMAKGLAKAGAQIAVWGRNEAKNAEAVAELVAMGGHAQSFEADVTDPASTAAAFDRTINAFGKIALEARSSIWIGKPGSTRTSSISLA